MMHMHVAVAVGQGEARYKPKEERRQEHPGLSASCIGRAGRGTEEAGIHPLVLKLEEMKGMRLAGGQRQARRDLGQRAAD